MNHRSVLAASLPRPIWGMSRMAEIGADVDHRDMSHPTSLELHQQTHGDASATSTRWIAAAGAALAVQFAAVLTGIGAAAILLAAAFSTLGDASAGTPAYIVFSIPVGIAAICLFFVSGYVAARIADDRRGWLMLIAGPLVWTLVSTAVGAL